MRRICFVTGTRAEFGLMGTTLRAIRARGELALQLVVTGMHLSPAHGRTIDDIHRGGWTIDRVVEWPEGDPAAATGVAMAGLAGAFAALDPEIVLVVGDRVEAFAAASAGAIGGRIVAHVHGGDRAQGQADDALRHAITKLAHLHLAATPGSAARIVRLGEDVWRVHTVGAPGIDGIVETASPGDSIAREFDVEPGRFALLVLHPTRDDDTAEHATAARLLDATLGAGLPRIVVIHPNNDPGHAGIVRCWDERAGDPRLVRRRDVPRPLFLGLLRDAAFLIGNSSSGIIEAASFGTPVIDVGPRQLGRERSDIVLAVEDDQPALVAAVTQIWRDGRPRKWEGSNVYGGSGTGGRIAEVLASVQLDDRLRRKLIAY